MSRKTHVYLISIATTFCVSALGCSGSNDPASSPGASTPAAAGAANLAGAANTSAGAPSSTAGAANTSAGAASSAAGAANTSAGAGGAGTAGAASNGGASAGAGTGAGTAGAPSTAGAFTPLCSDVPVTAAGAAPTKAGVCTATDTQVCYKSCGPQNTGFKSETCTTGAYQEQTGCSFPPDADYSCFKIPTTQDASCPTETITASTACTLKACTACSDATGHYLDTGMNQKVGYCVCPMPGASGTSKWSCASSTAWPCPTGKGCTP